MELKQMTPKLFWEILDDNLYRKGKSFGELVSILRKKGARTNLWYYRRVPQYPPFSSLKYFKEYMSDDDLYEAILQKDAEYKKMDEVESFLLSLHPSRSCIEQQRLRRKLQRMKN